ncbi:VOC family protein [Streptomyces sp. NPDC059788]|uniref:VOC family protein n=1 Tax=Streptomyces sp. NPDC059788 TaxID=3346948 RepID=UPI003668A982
MPFRSTTGTPPVDDVRPYYDRLVAEGAAIVFPPQEAPTGTGFTVRRPDGTAAEYVPHRPTATGHCRPCARGGPAAPPGGGTPAITVRLPAGSTAFCRLRHHAYPHYTHQRATRTPQPPASPKPPPATSPPPGPPNPTPNSVWRDRHTDYGGLRP